VNLRRRRLQLGVELGPAVGIDRGQVGAADVQIAQQRQGQGVALGMADDPVERDPDVPVDVALVGRPGRGMVMQAGAFDVGAVALGRRVVDAEQPERAGVDGPAQAAEEDAGEGIEVAPTEGPQQGVATAELLGHVAGAKPGGGGTAAVGEQGAEEQWFQQFGMAGVEQRG
jgi:hypothetical protein